VSRKYPKWMTAHISKCRVALGIDHPGFRLYVQRAVQVVAGRDEVGGDCAAVPRYAEASIRLRKDCRNTPTGREDVTHECIHAAFGRQREAITRIMELVPDPLRAHAWAIWTDANEATVTQLARGLTPLLHTVTRETRHE
jgi:hypothetical protein